MTHRSRCRLTALSFLLAWPIPGADSRLFVDDFETGDATEWSSTAP